MNLILRLLKVKKNCASIWPQTLSKLLIGKAVDEPIIIHFARVNTLVRHQSKIGVNYFIVHMLHTICSVGARMSRYNTWSLQGNVSIVPYLRYVLLNGS